MGAFAEPSTGTALAYNGASVSRTATRNVSKLAYNTYATRVCSTVGGGR